MKASTRAVVTEAEGTQRSTKYKQQDLRKESVRELGSSEISAQLKTFWFDDHINNDTSTEKRKFKNRNRFGREDDDFNLGRGVQVTLNNSMEMPRA